MLANDRHVCFIPAVDLDRAQAFYERTLGLEFLAEEGFARVLRLGDTTLRLSPVAGLEPRPFTVLGWEVADIDGALLRLRRLGVDAERFDSLPQDEHGVWHTPSGALVAWFRDSEGNLLSLTERR
jgi:catechol 2,3-dioxygenase-like lactoylglutathione lyase family enzyme